MSNAYNDLHVDVVLKYYNEMLKVKPKASQTKYPYIQMDEGEIIKTMKEIDMTYQNLKGFYTDNERPRRGGGGDGRIVIFTM